MYLFNPTAKPFLKWAGGKTQLIEEIKQKFPKKFLKEDFTFVEPFVGSGAVLFWVLNNFSNAKNSIINDINSDLIQVYKNIKYSPNQIIEVLEQLQQEFYSITDQDKKRAYYNSKRSDFIAKNQDTISLSALFIFLNKTCFNGLYRVNKKGEFNVPMGSYTKPLICDKNNILSVSKALERVEIISGDFEKTLACISENENTLFYLDPPYKPLSETSNFNAYSAYNFDDTEQVRLRDFCKKLDSLNIQWILSNSDMKNIDKNNSFFDDLYKDFSIERVEAKRSINSKGNKRGSITELLISNIKNENYVQVI